MSESLDGVLSLLLDQWRSDIQFVSDPWIFWLFIPMVFYFVLMLFKWTCFLIPVWLPVYLIFSSTRSSWSYSTRKSK